MSLLSMKSKSYKIINDSVQILFKTFDFWEKRNFSTIWRPTLFIEVCELINLEKKSNCLSEVRWGESAKICAKH
jgi:hypothetical protein